MNATEDAEVQHQVQSLQTLFQELNIPVDEDLGQLVASHSCPSSRRTSETRPAHSRCCPVHGCPPPPPSPPPPPPPPSPPPPLPPRLDRSNHNPVELHSSQPGQYTQVGAMPSTALYDRPQAPPRSPRGSRDAAAAGNHFPNHLKRRGSLTRLSGPGSSAGGDSPHHQQRRGSDNSTTGQSPGSTGDQGSSGASANGSTGGGGGTLGRNKGSSSSSGGLLLSDAYELSEEMKEHAVEMLERKYSGGAGLMTPHRAARVIQRNFRDFVFKKQFLMLRTERRPNRRLEHLQRSTSMLVDDGPAGGHAGHAGQPRPGSMAPSARPPGPGEPAGGILSRALKQANSFEDVLLERAYSACWAGAEAGAGAGRPGAAPGSGASSGGGSRDSGVDADAGAAAGAGTVAGQARRGPGEALPSHSTSTTSMNSAATEASSNSAASTGSSSSGISSTTAATVVVKGVAAPAPQAPHVGAVPAQHAWRQTSAPPTGAVWQQQSSGQQQQQSSPGSVGHQCSCQHHHAHSHHQHPAHHHRAGHAAHSGRAGHPGPGTSTPSPASSHSSVLSREKFPHRERSGVDTPPSAHPHSVSSERKRKRMYRVGLHIFNKKPERGLQFMMEKNFIGTSPQDVAQFLFTRKGLSRRMVGEYLGLLSNRFAQQVLDHYTELMDFRGLVVDEALRLFMSYFHMMGESQKIAKILEVFSYYYAKANPEWMCQNLCNWETLYTLVYGVVMLQTDLHNPSNKKRMRIEDFVFNLRGVDNGRNIDINLLHSIFCRIKSNKFELMPDHTDMVRNIAENLRSSKNSGEQSASGKESNSGQHLVANLVRSHRRLVCYCRLYEVTDMSKKEKPGAHLREVFLFNDMLLITKPVVKRISKEKVNHYRKHFSLHNVQVYLFESQFYPFGVQIKSSLDGSVLATFHHANESDRSGFVDDLHESVLELSYVESMRIEGDIQQSHRRATAAGLVSPAAAAAAAAAAATGSPRPPPPPAPHAGVGMGPGPGVRTNSSPQVAKDTADASAASDHDLLSLQAAHEQHLQAAAAAAGPKLTHPHPGGNRYSADSGLAEQEFGSAGSRTFYV